MEPNLLAVAPPNGWRQAGVAMEQIGKYVIESKLGQGGMGIVYKCRDPETGRPAAVKVLPQQLAAAAVFLQRFKREVLTLRRLDHPNIVRIYDQGEADDSYYYAMEFVEGIGLETVLEEKEKVQPLRAISIIRGCAEALEHSHAQGVVHRDIKPANIMLTPDGGIKLTDFGIAKVLDATRMTATQGVLGTVEYMSPEQSQGRHVDARSDLYSLGVVFYQCLTARTPITGSNPTEIIMKLRTHQIDSPDAWVPDLPKSLSSLVMRLLDKEPSKRVESARELLRELDRVQHQIESGITGQGPTTAQERVLTTGARAPAPAWRNLWLVCALIILLMAAGLYFVETRRGDEPDLPPQNAEKAPPAANVMLKWARDAREEKRYELAADLCNIIMKHYPGSGKAEEAREEIEQIEEDERRDAEEGTGEEKGERSGEMN